jgi:hypothetical protein
MAIASVIRNRNEEYANLLKRHSSSEKKLENLLSTKETEIQSAKQRYASEIADINSRLSSDTKAARTKQERQISTAVGAIEDEKRRLQDRISVLQASVGAVHERKLREAKDQRDNAFLAHRRALESQRQSAEESYQNGLNRITAERAAADQRQADELAQQDRMRLERIELLKHRRNECRRAVEKELAQYKSEIKSFLTRSHGRSRLTHQSDALLKATREYYSVVDNISRLNAGANAPTPRTDATADNERRRELERQRDTALEAAQIAYDNAIEASRR